MNFFSSEQDPQLLKISVRTVPMWLELFYNWESKWESKDLHTFWNANNQVGIFPKEKVAVLNIH
jgi:hypothetical protein